MGGVTINPVAGLAKPPEPGPSPVEQYANLLKLKQLGQAGQLQQQQGQINQEQLKQQQIQTQQAEQQQKDQEAFRTAMADPSMKGKTIGDIADTLAQSGNISQTAWQAAKKADTEHRKDLAEADEKTLKNRKEAHDATQNLYNNAMQMPDDQLQANWPQIAQQYNSIPGNEKMPLDPNKPLPKQALAQFAPVIDMGNAYFDQELARREKVAQAKKAESDAQKSEAEAAAYKSLGLPPGVNTELLGMADWLKKNPGKGASDFLSWKAKQAPLAQFNLMNSTGGANAAPEDVAKKFGMNSAAFDQAAERYWTTGQLPPIGRGGASSVALNRALMNRAADLHPNGSLAANSAEYKANADSLKGLQKNLDAVTAFENTANKNLDLFIGRAEKIVDTGSPWINKPLRSIERNALGNEDVAAYEAARQVAVNEIAKVTGNPGLSGQLSDSARHEVEHFNPDSATLKQTLEVAKVLKQDMANRRDSYAQQISDIKARFGGSPNQSNTPAPTSVTPKPKTSTGNQKVDSLLGKYGFNN